MELLNATKMQAGYTMGMKPDGRELLVVVVKGTFAVPERWDDKPRLAAKQVPLIMADTFSGEPGLSTPVYESDYAPYKPRCDVLLHGSAYAPRGRPAKRVTVALRVGAWGKSFDVVGNRTWQFRLRGPYPTEPEPFTVLPISYGSAFGGVDRSSPDETKHHYYLPNIVGVGFHVNDSEAAILGKPLPNTEETGRPVAQPNGRYRPMAFGPVGRGWEPRAAYAGTYDEKWLQEGFPFLPADFDQRYYQAAPEDQQIGYLRGGEEVELVNLTPDGHRRFRLPQQSVPVEFSRVDGTSDTVDAVLDTLLLEPDKNRFMLCWRASVPLRKNLFEIPAGIVGRMPRGWYRARELGKTYYPSLRELVADRSS